jgi:hypothetical protein
MATSASYELVAEMAIPHRELKFAVSLIYVYGEFEAYCERRDSHIA